MKNKGLIFGIVAVAVIGGVGYFIWKNRKKQTSSSTPEGGISPEAESLCQKYAGKYVRGKTSGKVYRMSGDKCHKIHWTCATTAKGWNYNIAEVMSDSELDKIPTKSCNPLKANWGYAPMANSQAKSYCNTYADMFIRGTDNMVYFIPKNRCMKVHFPCVNPQWNKSETWKYSKRVPQAVVDAIPTAKNCKPL